MTEEAKVRVRLNTSAAKSDLRELTKDAEASGKRINEKMSGGGAGSAIGRGLKMAGAGAAFGAGMQAMKSGTASGIGSIIGEAFGGIGAEIEHFLLGDKASEARADREARERVMQGFSAQSGRLGAVPEGALNYFQQTRAMILEEEKGKGIIRRDERFGTMSLEPIFKRIGELISEGVDALAGKIVEGVGGMFSSSR